MNVNNEVKQEEQPVYNGPISNEGGYIFPSNVSEVNQEPVQYYEQYYAQLCYQPYYQYYVQYVPYVPAVQYVQYDDDTSDVQLDLESESNSDDHPDYQRELYLEFIKFIERNNNNNSISDEEQIEGDDFFSNLEYEDEDEQFMC